MLNLKSNNINPKDLLLYAITDRHWLNGRTLSQQVRECLEGGATIIQIREKKLSEEEFLEEAKEIQSLCKEFNVPFIVNDNINIAAKIKADGVHVGQEDMDAKKVRTMLGENAILGVSASTVEEALKAEKDGADYLGVGAVFNTSTKDDADSVSFDTLKEICNSVSIPVVAIGGISASNILELKGSGIDGVSVISAIFASDDIKEATKNLKELAKSL
ncbi:thiamine phosphate synthase [Peptacetobacter sp.]|uniref:thiamine phosphate synthase n=1 Tax=Peptacetobacter sp. TaxID=2991975 RepID=UPI002FE6EC87